MIDRKLIAHFDWILFFQIIGISLIGLVVLYSAGYNPDSEGFSLIGYTLAIKSTAFARQFMFLLFGFFVLILIVCVSTQVMYKISYPIYVASILSLVAVLIIGLLSHGSRRWFPLGPINLQPSEFAKVAFILGFARLISSREVIESYSFKSLIIPSIFSLLPVFLIMKQPDLGTALCILFIASAMILLVGVRKKVLAYLVIFLLIAFPLVWSSVLKPYQKRRIVTLLNPDADPLGSGYHVIQSKIAVGSGGFSGKGYLKGTQTQLEFLPEHTTDFVFSVLAEEWGFIGCIIVLILYCSLIYSIMSVALRSRDLFPTLVCTGVSALILFHVLVNIGMVLGLMPVVGLPLPLLSYGGSSVISIMIALGIVLGLSMRRISFTS